MTQQTALSLGDFHLEELRIGLAPLAEDADDLDPAAAFAEAQRALFGAMPAVAFDLD